MAGQIKAQVGPQRVSLGRSAVCCKHGAALTDRQWAARWTTLVYLRGHCELEELGGRRSSLQPSNTLGLFP